MEQYRPVQAQNSSGDGQHWPRLQLVHYPQSSMVISIKLYTGTTTVNNSKHTEYWLLVRFVAAKSMIDNTMQAESCELGVVLDPILYKLS